MNAWAAFLRTRIEEEEAVALADYPEDSDSAKAFFAAVDLRDRQLHTSRCAWRSTEGLSQECECLEPSRSLAKCEARRRIIERYELEVDLGYLSSAAALEEAIVILAAPYADHPDHPAHRGAFA